MKFYGRIISNEICHCISSNQLELRYLELTFTTVSLNGIKSLCKLEKLEELNISCNKEIDDSCIELISKSLKLKVLKISGPKITGLGFGNFSSLRKLDCSRCINLEGSNIIDLLRSASNLEELDIRSCKEITNSVIDVAIEVSKTRINNVLLTICLSYVNHVDFDKIEKESPLLHLPTFLFCWKLCIG